MFGTYIDKTKSGYILKKGSNQYNLTNAHFDAFVQGFFSANAMLKKIKKKSILFLMMSEERHIFNAGGFKIGTLKKGDEKQDFLDFYNSNDFSIIAGFNNAMRIIEPVEIFFEHGTDALILLNSGNLHNADSLRSTFNAPCYMANYFIGKQRVFRCRRGNYHIAGNAEWEKLKDYSNLNRVIESKDELFILNGNCACGKGNMLDGTLFYNKKHIVELRQKDGLKKAFSRYIIEKELHDDLKNILSVKVTADEQAIHAEAEIYEAHTKSMVQKKIEQYFMNIIAQDNLENYTIDMKIDIFE